jgi:hypothetical protein
VRLEIHGRGVALEAQQQGGRRVELERGARQEAPERSGAAARAASSGPRSSPPATRRKSKKIAACSSACGEAASIHPAKRSTHSPSGPIQRVAM